MSAKLDGLGIAYGLGGFVLLWSGVKNTTVKDTLTAFLKGQPPQASPTGPVSIGITQPAGATGNVSAGTAVSPGVAGSGGTPAQNQALAKLMVAMSHPSWGTGQQWQDWLALWNRESGWSQTAQNPSSGAYGIPQALPYTKMPKSAWPPADGGSSNPAAQISWGINYIAQTYGSPSAAWAHEQAQGWY